MVALFFVASVLLAVMMMSGVVRMKKYKHPLRNSVQLLFVAAAVTIMFNALAVMVSTEWSAVFFHGLYFASTDWLVLVLLNYAKLYTDGKRVKPWVKWLIYLGAAVDSISMLANTFTHHVFDCVEVVIGTDACYVVSPHLPVYGIHLAYVYSLTLLVLAAFVVKTVSTIRLYRKKYEIVLWTFLLILAVNVGYRFVNFPIDFSPVTYLGVALASYYFTLIFVPKNIVIRLLSMSVQDMESGIVCFDREGKCLYANEKAQKIFGAVGSHEPLENFFAQWRSDKEAEDFQEGIWHDERMVEGALRYFEVSFKLLLDDRGHYIGCFFTMDDQTDERDKLEQERYRASHDKLTGIYNRERFFEKVEQVLKQKPEEKRVITCIDIKDFKTVNDLFGEETGNTILRDLAGIMRREASPDTFYGRLESDRFAMCMREQNFCEERYWGYLEELKKLIKSSVYRMHIHVGVYHITDPSMNISVMCDRAFMAISHIKDNYQQIVSHYSDDMGKMAQRAKTMVGEFDRALAAGEFKMYLQPQVSVNQELLGAEALVRWDHPVRGMISPAVFIPIFESSGCIPRLDRYMWEQACKQLQIWKEQGWENLHISVNISPRDFYFINIYDAFTELVEQYGINPKNLKLEITESALMDDVSRQLDLLERLRSYGFQVEIDDFGSGYSSLNTLKDINVDVLKLDMGFLHDTGHKDRSRIIMNATIDMAKRLGLTVVTEGVETIEQVNYLTEVGCDIFQGYYFSKPVPVYDFEQKYFLDKKNNLA